MSVRIEGLARLLDDRPHGLSWSTHPRESRHYSINDINTKLMRRGRRRSKRKSGVDGGISIVHPARIRGDCVDELKGRGYGTGDGERGLWVGVRDDVLELGDWREYAKYEPHGHSIGFPGWIEPHEGDGEFIVEKYDVFESLENVVNHVEYLMHHRMTYRGDSQFTSVRPWGMMHHGSNEYVDIELAYDYVDELGVHAYEALCREVAAEFSAEWSRDEGLHYPDDENAVCPECGIHKSKFIDLWDLPGLASPRNQGGAEWINRLSPGQRVFFEEIIEILCHDEDPRIYRGDVVHPDDVAIWIDGDRDRPPPVVGE